MDHFEYENDELFAEQVSLKSIAERVGTPCYVYSRATLERHWHAFNDAFENYPHRICYAVKANSNLAVLNLLARLGSGFDIVSGGELRRVIKAGGDPGKTIFSGVGKLEWEIREALEHDIDCFNIESEGELQRISKIAESLNKTAAISVRINPDVDAKTHPYISTGLRGNKFGLTPERAMKIYEQASTDEHIHISGVACHIGSQLTELEPYRDALDRILDFVDMLESRDIIIDHIDFGGGLGVRYHSEEPPSPKQYWATLRERLKSRGRNLPVTIEPGRAIVGNAGVLLTAVNYIKEGELSNFCVVDAGMNDLIRPALYQAYQKIIEVNRGSSETEKVYDVVGPVCESADFLGKERTLRVEEGDLLAVRTSGAYAAVMSSNYNARPRPAEVMVDDRTFHIVKERESLESLYEGEHILP
ncbi:MAG: diaminopimelate decarboxylase [Gammaproteobacteria bacterium]|nr:diaminopimelate decarboxylase [Gammaproteobacteria bacterium]